MDGFLEKVIIRERCNNWREIEREMRIMIGERGMSRERNVINDWRDERWGKNLFEIFFGNVK